MDRIDEIDAALCALDRTRTPLEPSNKNAIRESLRDAEPLTDAQRLRIARLLAGSRVWQALRQGAAA